jgi:hypothetical protein
MEIGKSMMKPLLAGVGVALLTPTLVQAEETAPADRFKLSLGSYSIFKSDTSVALTERTLGTGLALNPRDTLGVDIEDTVARLDARYRFTPEHAVGFSWYRISTSASRSLAQDIEWVDNDGEQITLSAGARVDTDFTYDIYSLAYQWSFYRSDQVELFASAGLHGTRFALDLDAQVSGSGTSADEARDVSSSIPLPVFGMGLRYQVTPTFNWYMQTQLFTIEIGDWNGTFSNIDVGMEYWLLPYLAVGLGVGSNTLDVTETTDDYRFVYANKLTGVNLFLSTQF